MSERQNVDADFCREPDGRQPKAQAELVFEDVLAGSRAGKLRLGLPKVKEEKTPARCLASCRATGSASKSASGGRTITGAMATPRYNPLGVNK